MYNFTLSGIFFDESPYQDDGVFSSLHYIETVTSIAKSPKLTGFGKHVFTVQNPGSVPPKNHLGPQESTDTTIILEGTWDTYSAGRAKTYDNLASTEETLIGKFSIILNSVPVGWSDVEWRTGVKNVATDAGYIFMTDNSESDAYSRFAYGWENFIKAVAVT